MTGRQAVLLVAKRELVQRAKSKAYIMSTAFMTLLLVGAVLLPILFSGDATTYRVGSVGPDNLPIVDTARSLARESADGPEEADRFEIVEFADVAAAEAAVDSGDVEAALVDGRDVIVAGVSSFTGSDLSQILQRAAGARRVQDLVAASADAAEVVQLLSSEPLQVRNIKSVDGEDEETRGVVAFGGLILMYVAVLTYGAWMLSGVTEEKTNRVVEVLLSTLRPWQMFAGKLLGIGLLGVGQLVFVLSLALVALRVSDAFQLPSLPLDQVFTLILWFILGFALYAALFGAAGSLVSRMEDAQTAAAPMSIVAVLGYLLSFATLNDPSSTIARVATFVPVTAPYVVPIRTALRSIEPWEIVLAVLVMLATIVVVVRLAGRVYAGGVLKTGGKVGWREAFRGAAE